jgi:hypothetical protein
MGNCISGENKSIKYLEQSKYSNGELPKSFAQTKNQEIHQKMKLSE